MIRSMMRCSMKDFHTSYFTVTQLSLKVGNSADNQPPQICCLFSRTRWISNRSRVAEAVCIVTNFQWKLGNSEVWCDV